MIVTVYAKELLAAAKIASNKKNDKPHLRCVSVVCDDDGYTIAATDSFTIIEFTCAKHVSGYHISGECVLDIEDIKANVKTSDTYVHIECDDSNNVAIETYKWKKGMPIGIGVLNTDANIKASGWKFVNYKKLLNDWKVCEDKPSGMCVDATYVATICNAMEMAYGKNTPVDIVFEGAYKPVHFQSNVAACNRWCKAMLMPLRKDVK